MSEWQLLLLLLLLILLLLLLLLVDIPHCLRVKYLAQMRGVPLCAQMRARHVRACRR